MASSPPSFVGIRYQDNNAFAVLKVKDVFRFNPQYMKDFSDVKIYLAKWFATKKEQKVSVKYDKDGWDMNFYKIQIFALSHRKDEVQKIIDKKRIVIPAYRIDLNEDEKIVFEKGLAALSEKEKKKKIQSASSVKKQHQQDVMVNKNPSTSKQESVQLSKSTSSTTATFESKPPPRLNIQKILAAKKKNQEDNKKISTPLVIPAAEHRVEESDVELESLREQVKQKKEEIKRLNSELKASRKVYLDCKDECENQKRLLRYQAEEIAALKKQIGGNSKEPKCREENVRPVPKLKRPAQSSSPTVSKPLVSNYHADGNTPHHSIDNAPFLRESLPPTKTPKLDTKSLLPDEGFCFDEPKCNKDKSVTSEQEIISIDDKMDEDQNDTPNIKSEITELDSMELDDDRNTQLSAAGGSTSQGAAPLSRKKLKDTSENKPYRFRGPEPFLIKGDKIHLVNDEWMEHRKWLVIQSERKDQLFNSKCYGALYGSETLLERSWSGHPSPRNSNLKSTNPISPEKKKTLLWLMEDRLRKLKFPEDRIEEHARKVVQGSLTSKASNNRRAPKPKTEPKADPKADPKAEPKAGSSTEPEEPQGTPDSGQTE